MKPTGEMTEKNLLVTAKFFGLMERTVKKGAYDPNNKRKYYMVIASQIK